MNFTSRLQSEFDDASEDDDTHGLESASPAKPSADKKAAAKVKAKGKAMAPQFVPPFASPPSVYYSCLCCLN